MANSVDPDQTAPIGHFQMHFFLGALRVKITFFESRPMLFRIYCKMEKIKEQKSDMGQ